MTDGKPQPASVRHWVYNLKREYCTPPFEFIFSGARHGVDVLGTVGWTLDAPLTFAWVNRVRGARIRLAGRAR